MSYLATPQMTLADVQHTQVSLLDHFEPDRSTIPKTHFVEWFDGDALDSIWTTLNRADTNTFQMSDGIDQGFEIITAAAGNADAIVAFNDINHYSRTGSRVHFVVSESSQTSHFQLAGFTNNDATSSNRAGLNTDSNVGTDYFLNTRSTGSQTNVNLGTAQDANFHYFSVEMKTSSVDMWLNGILSGTSTTNLPVLDPQPYFRQGTRESVAKTGRIRYLEAYNT